MDTILVWIGGTSFRYGLVATVAGTALLAAAWDVRRVPPWVYLAALAACLLAFRWPIALYNGELGIDESQMVAGALTLRHHPIAWKYVDLNTVGPLNAYPIAALGWLGLPVNFVVTHLFGLATLWVTVGSGYLLLRENCDERLARCAMLPAAAFFSLTTFFDFIHYTSEHVPLALLGLGAAGVWRGYRHGRALDTFVGTLALGAVPWAKLQGVPVALWFALGGGTLLAWRWWGDPERRWPVIGAWLGGGVFASAGFGLMLWIWGLGHQWRLSYIDQATAYVGLGHGSVTETLREFLASTGMVAGFNAFVWPLLLVVFLVAGSVLFNARPRNALLLLYVAGALVVSLYVIGTPGRVFYHYLLFLVMPLTLCTAVLLDAALAHAASLPRPRGAAFANVILAIFLAVTLVPLVRSRWARGHAQIPYRAGNSQLQRSAAARILATVARPGDTLTVWGWMPRLYVESRLPQGIRDGQTERQIITGLMQNFYRGRYLHDLARYRPRFFVEAVGPGQFAYTDRAAAGFETWPELRAFVHEHYVQFAETENCRLFALKADPPPPSRPGETSAAAPRRLHGAPITAPAGT